MFNKNKVRKVNDLLDVAENCLNNKDRENARKAMEESYNLILMYYGMMISMVTMISVYVVLILNIHNFIFYIKFIFLSYIKCS